MADNSVSPETLADLYGRPFRSVAVAVPGVNVTLRIDADDATYWLRLYRKSGRSRAQIDAELAVLLAADNVAKPVSLVNGGYVFPCIHAGDVRNAVLFFEAPGQRPDATPANLKQVGAALARLHSQLRALYPVGRPFSPDDTLGAACASLEALGADFWPVRRRIEQMQQGLCAALRAPAAVRGVCHGDAWLGNVRQLGSQITFFDFDDCFDGPVVADVARLLASLWHNDVPSFARAAPSVIDGYSSGLHLDRADWQLVPALAQLDAIDKFGFLARYCSMDPSLWEDARAQVIQALNDWSADGKAASLFADAFAALAA